MNLYTENDVKQIAWKAYISRTDEKEFEIIHRKSAKEEFEKWWNKNGVPNVDVDKIINILEDQSMEWSFGQGTKVGEERKMVSNSFIEGGKLVIDLLQGKEDYYKNLLKK